MQQEKEYSENLNKGAKAYIFSNAKELRKKETEAEKILWKFLRNRQVKSKKFRRQHAVDKYILDFYCHECSLAIEVDGGIHFKKMNRQYDEARTYTLNGIGIKVILSRCKRKATKRDRAMV